GFRFGGYTGSFVTVLMFAILALGLNIVVGYAGLLDLGYAAFFAIGAYTMALVTTPTPPWHDPAVPFPFSYFWVGLLIAAAVGLFAGVIIGSPTIPLRGDYLAIVTLGFGEIIPVVFRNLTCVSIPFLTDCLDLTAGERGVNPIALPIVPFTNITFSKVYLAPWFWLAVLLVLFLVFVNQRLEQSRLGRAWMAMREDEDAAAAMGVDVVRTKLLAFAMGAMFSGFAGAYYASYVQAVFPSNFDFTVSIVILCAVILGGIGNPYGALLGGLVVVGIDRVVLPAITGMFGSQTIGTIYAPSSWRYGLFGFALVLMMLFRPEGLLPSAARARELHAAEEEEELSGIEAAELERAREAEAG
ncbi:MAG: branched-chain amino acid ABC transporter permease, partial [candidate division KSB1 bacterium]|nr:branched-chain amino acid ABC transporter permease [candidate division KSB1 bacterium]